MRKGLSSDDRSSFGVRKAMPSIRQFEAFRALVRHRHFGRAAQALGVTQPALTRALQKLERGLGAPLFDRHGMTPTAFGKAALRFAEPAVGGYSELLREISLLQGAETGELRVAMGPYPADISGTRAAAIMSCRHPRLAISLRVCDWGEAIRDVAENVADLALAEVSEAEKHPELETELVRRGRGYFFCRARHPLAKRKRLVLDDLLEFPWAGPIYPGRVAAHLPRVDKPFGVFDLARDQFRPRLLVETFALAKELALNGDAISAFAPGQLDDELNSGRCVRLPIDVPALSLNYGFIVKRGRTLSPASKAFMEIVLEIERSIRAGQAAGLHKPLLDFGRDSAS
jgi:DNA-binding transcriptional LysR family regulator